MMRGMLRGAAAIGAATAATGITIYMVCFALMNICV